MEVDSQQQKACFSQLTLLMMHSFEIQRQNQTPQAVAGNSLGTMQSAFQIVQCRFLYIYFTLIYIVQENKNIL